MRAKILAFFLCLGVGTAMAHGTWPGSGAGVTDGYVGDVAITGTITVDGLSVRDNAAGNTVTLLENAGDEAEKTCAADGTANTLSILDRDDGSAADETNWYACDGIEPLGPVAPLSEYRGHFNVSNGGSWGYTEPSGPVIDTVAWFCPASWPFPNDSPVITVRGGSHTSIIWQCMVPLGYKLRIHRLAFIASATLGSVEDCTVKVSYDNTNLNSPDLGDGCATCTILDDAAAGGGFFDLQNAGANLNPGQTRELEMDFTEEITGVWAIKIFRDPAGSDGCEGLNTGWLSVYHEYLPIVTP